MDREEPKNIGEMAMKSLASHLRNHLHQHEYYDSTRRTANQKLSMQLNQSTESNSWIYQTNKKGKVVLEIK